METKRKNIIEKIDDYTVFLNTVKNIGYDGTQIEPHWVYNNCNVLGPSIYIFKGPMSVAIDQMCDLSDIKKEKDLATAQVLIKSEDALNFIIEDFHPSPPNLELQNYRLRLFVNVVFHELQNLFPNVPFKQQFTDLYVNNAKLSVGIAVSYQTSAKIHYALNITSKLTPSYVKCVGLNELDTILTTDELLTFAYLVATKYISELTKIKNDVYKTRIIK